MIEVGMAEEGNNKTVVVEGLSGTGLNLFSWGPGDSFVVVNCLKERNQPHLLPRVAESRDVLELRFRAPWQLWRYIDFVSCNFEHLPNFNSYS